MTRLIENERNVCSDENGRFDEILLTKLADLSKFGEFGHFVWQM